MFYKKVKLKIFILLEEEDLLRRNDLKRIKRIPVNFKSDTFVDPSEAILNKSSEDELSDRKGRAAKKIYELFAGYAEPKKNPIKQEVFLGQSHT